MRVIVAVLALAAVASAAPMEAFHDMERFISVYGAPKTIGEFYLPQENTGVKGLFDQTIIVNYKSPEKEELVSVFLQDGLKSVYQFEELAFLKKALFAGREKVFLYLSAARFLAIPELELPVRGVVAPAADHHGNLYQKFARSVPSVFLIDEERLLASDKMKTLFEYGQFAFRFNTATISRDSMAQQLLQEPIVQAQAVQEVVPMPQELSQQTDLEMNEPQKTEMLPPLPSTEVFFASALNEKQLMAKVPEIVKNMSIDELHVKRICFEMGGNDAFKFEKICFEM